MQQPNLQRAPLIGNRGTPIDLLCRYQTFLQTKGGFEMKRFTINANIAAIPGLGSALALMLILESRNVSAIAAPCAEPFATHHSYRRKK